MGEMRDDVAAALRRDFGYVPQSDDGEKWTVYQDRTLIVIHPHRQPRLYRYGCGGSYYEIEPIPA